MVEIHCIKLIKAFITAVHIKETPTSYRCSSMMSLSQLSILIATLMATDTDVIGITWDHIWNRDLSKIFPLSNKNASRTYNIEIDP